MWKIFAGFIAFALLALFVILKGGDKIDMQGEAGGHAASESASAPTAASAAPPAAGLPAAASAATSAAAVPGADAAAPSPTKSSTTGTIVGGTAASAATSK